MIIGVTGISGSGKSTLTSEICMLKGAKNIDADMIAKQMQKPGEEYYNKIVESFSSDILKPTGEIDRVKFASLIFSDKEKKRRLDELTLTYVVPKIRSEAEEYSKIGIAVIDAALLFDMGLDKICDITIGMLSKREVCIKRVCKRDGIDDKKANSRLDNQNDENFFKMNCDYCINNDKEESLEKDIEKILNGENLSNKAVIHMNLRGVEYLQFRKLLEFSNKIKHCYTLKPLDFKIDDKVEYFENYNKICEVLDIDLKKIYRPHQTHSSNVKGVNYEIEGIHKEEFEGIDGLITDKKDKVLSLVFADCICLYFYDPIKNVIGNVHSGWKGTYQEIARNAIQLLKNKYDVNPENLICCIAPSIRDCCFEVDRDLKDMFFEKFKKAGRTDDFIRKSKDNGKYYIDTVLINKLILKDEGLIDENIIDCEICTKCNSNKLHSYREENMQSGRNTSIITIV